MAVYFMEKSNTKRPRAIPNGCHSSSSASSSSSPNKDMAKRRSGLWMSGSVGLNILLLLVVAFQKQEPISNGASSSIQSLESTHHHPCSHHGFLLEDEHSHTQVCKCHACFQGKDCSERDSNCIINLDHGDPRLFEAFWRKEGVVATTTVISGGHGMSYFSEAESICWFLEQKLAREIRALHHAVGNAVTKGYYIVVGTGSTQLFQAALHALSSSMESDQPLNVVSEAPFYSFFAAVAEYLNSSMYRWAGDAVEFNRKPHSDNYIEVVIYPNNPDGSLRQAVVDGNGARIYDLAYYWPHYTPISDAADHSIMLFTFSKITGHAGTRIGWALVKDEKVARKMSKFIELNTIGVSRDAQLRAAHILRSVVNTFTARDDSRPHLFSYGYGAMQYRWEKLRSTLTKSDRFSVAEYSSAYCSFFGIVRTSHPAFAWVKCNHEPDCEEYMQRNRMRVRGGRHFGADPKFVRMSMLDEDEVFDMFIHRLESLA